MILSNVLLESSQSNIQIEIKHPSELNEIEKSEVIHLLNILLKEEQMHDSQLNLKTDQSQYAPYSNSDYKKLIGKRRWMSDHRFVLAKLDGHVIGTMYYKEHNADYNGYIGKHCFIHDVIVDPKFRQLGIGTKMFKFLKLWIKKNRPATLMFLGVMTNNVAGIKLYEKMGFYPIQQLMVCKL